MTKRGPTLQLALHINIVEAYAIDIINAFIKLQNNCLSNTSIQQWFSYVYIVL